MSRNSAQPLIRPCRETPPISSIQPLAIERAQGPDVPRGQEYLCAISPPPSPARPNPRSRPDWPCKIRAGPRRSTSPSTGENWKNNINAQMTPMEVTSFGTFSLAYPASATRIIPKKTHFLNSQAQLPYGVGHWPYRPARLRAAHYPGFVISKAIPPRGYRKIRTAYILSGYS